MGAVEVLADPRCSLNGKTRQVHDDEPLIEMEVRLLPASIIAKVTKDSSLPIPNGRQDLSHQTIRRLHQAQGHVF